MLPLDAARYSMTLLRPDNGHRDLCTHCGLVVEYDAKTDGWFSLSAFASNSPDPWGCSFALVHEAGGV